MCNNLQLNSKEIKSFIESLSQAEKDRLIILLGGTPNDITEAFKRRYYTLLRDRKYHYNN